MATPTAAEAGAEGPDVVGTDCIPPPGGREGGVLKIGAPPANLMEVPGEPCGHGRVKRGPVSLEGGAVYEGTWKVSRHCMRMQAPERERARGLWV